LIGYPLPAVSPADALSRRLSSDRRLFFRAVRNVLKVFIHGAPGGWCLCGSWCSLMGPLPVFYSYSFGHFAGANLWRCYHILLTFLHSREGRGLYAQHHHLSASQFRASTKYPDVAAREGSIIPHLVSSSAAGGRCIRARRKR
jgi:hypothetical protein